MSISDQLSYPDRHGECFRLPEGRPRISGLNPEGPLGGAGKLLQQNLGALREVRSARLDRLVPSGRRRIGRQDLISAPELLLIICLNATA
jgi:hypothetical protein